MTICITSLSLKGHLIMWINYNNTTAYSPNTQKADSSLDPEQIAI